MDPQVAAAYIAGGAALVGAVIAGAIALLAQRWSQRGELKRWRAEADERARTRFHDARLRVYAEFLESAAKDTRLSLKIAMKHRMEALGEPDTPLAVDEHGLTEHSPQETNRLHREVQLLTMSPNVRDTAEKLRALTWSYAAIDSNAGDFHGRIAAAARDLEREREAFIQAAREEIAG